MTRKEAIEYNKNLREYMRITDKKSEYKFLNENYEALDMAIKALEQEPCEDAISRQEVMYALCDACELFHKNGEETCLTKCESYHFLATLPPVTSKEKTAEWYEENGCKGACEGYMSAGVICSQCGEVFCGYIGDYNFCPNCGARMVSE